MNNFFGLYKRYISLSKKYKSLHILGIIASIILLVSYNLVPLAIGQIIDSANSVEELDMFKMILLIGVLIASPLILEPLTFYPKSRHLGKLMRDLMHDVYKNVIEQDYNYHVNKQTGKMISIILNSRSAIDMFLWRLEWFTMENFGNLMIPVVVMILSLH
ncbi:MAG: ABC transporter transmembrane domain-containing protein [Candidatus Dojkabacteria bacterium]|nr:ABC transporter transmembrane domain-containing protein [Candidatus Dojkabacteria bacterium]MDQ7020363.1 ABC transporter transmembrane domain-containing protein [Candidatus Dojkabacteria bacterium]